MKNEAICFFEHNRDCSPSVKPIGGGALVGTRGGCCDKRPRLTENEGASAATVGLSCTVQWLAVVMD